MHIIIFIAFLFSTQFNSAYAQESCDFYTKQLTDTVKMKKGLYQETISSLVETADGRVFCGATKINDTLRYLLLRKYLPSGEVDIKFGKNGVAVYPESGEGACVINAGNKLLAGGCSFGVGTWADAGLWRFDASGKPDVTFNGSGFVRLNVSEDDEDVIVAIAIQPDGKIVACGYVLISHGLFVVRYHPDGKLDTGFGKNGLVVFYDQYFEPTGICIQRDNKILVSGTDGGLGEYNFALCRLNTDGSPDTGFGKNGFSITSVNPANDQTLAICELSDGRIEVIGYAWNSQDYITFLTKAIFSKNGILDETFCKRGYVSKKGILQDNENWEKIEITTDGNFIIHNFTTADDNINYSKVLCGTDAAIKR